MGKRSDFARIPKDLYRTWDPRALPPLLRHLPRGCHYVEPCAGAGDLIRQLKGAGHHCIAASDIDPLAPGIAQGDALKLRSIPDSAEMIITNPPWKRSLLHRLIPRFTRLRPTWLLLDANWMFTDQAAPFLRHCPKIVVIGRLKWIEGSKDDAVDDAAWFHFNVAYDGHPTFYPKVPK